MTIIGIAAVLVGIVVLVMDFFERKTKQFLLIIIALFCVLLKTQDKKQEKKKKGLFRHKNMKLLALLPRVVKKLL